MKPKKTAKKIFEKMFNVSDKLNKYPMCFDTAKACTLIAIDLRLDGDFSFTSIKYGEDSLEHWQEVRRQAEKL